MENEVDENMQSSPELSENTRRLVDNLVRSEVKESRKYLSSNFPQVIVKAGLHLLKNAKAMESTDLFPKLKVIDDVLNPDGAPLHNYRQEMTSEMEMQFLQSKLANIKMKKVKGISMIESKKLIYEQFDFEVSPFTTSFILEF